MTQHHDTPAPYALAEADAYFHGWPSTAGRTAAFHDLRALAARVIAWLVTIGAPPADATTVWVWTEDRLDKRELANGDVFEWPASCDGVPPASRGDLLRAACRFEFDHWRRQQPDLLDAIRACEGDGLPWVPAEESVRDAALVVVRQDDAGAERPVAGYSRGARLFVAGVLRRLGGEKAA